MSAETEALKKDIDQRFESFGKILDAGINAIKEIFRNFVTTNEKAHDELKTEYREIRAGMKDIYERINKDKDEADVKISTVRVDLENKIGDVSQEVEDLKLAPGKKASEILTKIGQKVLLTIIGMAVMALIWWISQGASATNIPIP